MGAIFAAFFLVGFFAGFISCFIIFKQFLSLNGKSAINYIRFFKEFMNVIVMEDKTLPDNVFMMHCGKEMYRKIKGK